MDKFDQQIITQLTQNARQSVSDIARKISLSRSATQERIRQLEERGVIEGYHAKIVDPDKKEWLNAYFEVQGQGQDRFWSEYTQLLQSIPEVRRCHFISGQVDLIVFVEAPTMSRIEAIRVALEGLPNVTLVRTHMVMRTLIDR